MLIGIPFDTPPSGSLCEPCIFFSQCLNDLMIIKKYLAVTLQVELGDLAGHGVAANAQQLCGLHAAASGVL